MEGKSNSKTKARLIVLAVFVIGFAAGALSLNLYQRLTNQAEPRQGGINYIINKMDQKVGLTQEQQDKIKAILEERNSKFGEIREKMAPVFKEFEPQFDALRQEYRNKIREALTDEQRPKYEELLQEQDRQRDQMKGRKSRR